MTYNVFGGTLSLTQSINRKHRHLNYRTLTDTVSVSCCGILKLKY